MKKTLILMLAFILCLPNVAFAGEDYAQVKLKTGFPLHNVTKYSVAKYENEVKDGIPCVKPFGDFYIDVHDYFMYSSVGTNAKITVDYFDDSDGEFYIKYNAVHGGAEDIPVKLGNTKQWKSYEFSIFDAAFCNSLANGYDIAICSKNVAFSQIKIINIGESQINMSLSTKQRGNIFGPGETKTFTAVLTGTTSAAVDMTFKIYDMYDKCIDAQKKSLNADEDKKLEFNANIAKFGVYKAEFELSYKNGENTLHEKRLIDFSVINEFTEDDEPNETFGICKSDMTLYKNGNDMEDILSIIKRSGASYLRHDKEWGGVERTRGIYDIDPEIPSVVKDSNIHSLYNLAYGNMLYTGGFKNAPVTDEEIEGFKNYCVQMVTQLKGIVDCFEIWNEYNGIPNFNATGEPPENYAKMLKAVYPAIKKANPQATVVGGVVAGVNLEWLKRIFDAGAYDCMDVFSFHYYDTSKCFEKSEYLKSVSEMRKLMSQYGEMKDIWFDETGWTTAQHIFGISEYDRMIFGVQMYALMTGYGLVDKMFWYDLQNDGDNITYNEHNYGLIRQMYSSRVTPWSASAAFVSLTGMNKMIGNSDVIGVMNPDSDTYIFNYKRKNDGKNVIVAWSDAQSKTLGLKLGANTANMYDIASNNIGCLNSENGIFEITLSREPIYLEGNFSSFEETVGGITADTSGLTIVKGETAVFKLNDTQNRNLSLNADTNLTVEKVDSTSIEFKTDAEGEYTADISAYDGEKLVYKGKNSINVTKPVSIDIDLKEIGNDYYSAVVSLTNLSKKNSVSGKAELVYDGVIENNGNTAVFTDILPGETQQFYLRYPKMSQKHLVNVCSQVTLNNGYICRQNKNFDYTQIRRAVKQPVIDGILSDNEWNTTTWFYAENTESVQLIENWGGKSDESFAADIMWDEDNLYLAVNVKDNIFYQPYSDGDTWKGDCVQFAVDSRQSGKTGKDYTEMMLALTPMGTQAYRVHGDGEIKGGMFANADLKINRTSSGLVYELKIPWSELIDGQYVPKENDCIGFSILSNDNDGNGRRGWVQYYSGIGYDKDNSLYGELKLNK